MVVTTTIVLRFIKIITNLDYIFAADMDSLLVTEWNRLEDIERLLKPFAEMTDLLQTDTQSISSIIPSILDLEIHLQEYPSADFITTSVLRDMRRRFTSIMKPDSDNFNPIPAAACFLDPTLKQILDEPEMGP